MPLADHTDRALSTLIDLSGRVAVVTGGAAGVGAAIVRRLAEAGADVLVGDLDQAAAEATAKEHDGHLGRVVGAALDVTDSDAIRAIADRAFSDLGGLDIWVNNAGIYPSAPVLEITDDGWDQVLALNLRSTFVGAREAAARMIDAGHGGVIVNLASTAAFNASHGANSAHYVASKHGVAGVTKSLATELAEHGIRAVAVAPTLTETPGVSAKRAGGAAEALAAYGAALPSGRLAVPDDIARVVLFAASDLAGFVTGTTIPADGGDIAAG